MVTYTDCKPCALIVLSGRHNSLGTSGTLFGLHGFLTAELVVHQFKGCVCNPHCPLREKEKLSFGTRLFIPKTTAVLVALPVLHFDMTGPIGGSV